ncbi:calcium-binding protein [Ramlibacter sp. PS3R-8]|uniref:calcium-binding protein n=1 Tax=Ramlibacter sp. PS3R-8 TaxID=3133437 RepID=UPI00309814DB
MTIRNVGPSSTYPTIAAAVGASAAGDTIRLAPGYSDERAVLTVQDLTVQGAASSRNIDLELGLGINNVTLAGFADIDVWDNSGNNAITGNSGDSILRVSGGADVVIGGDGVDRLVVDYSDAVASVIGTVTGVTDGGTRSVTYDASVENFTIQTGSGDDTVTTGDGDNVLNTRGGNDTITTGHGDSRVSTGGGNDTVGVGNGQNTVHSGAGDDTVTTGDGDNRVNAGNGNNTVTTGDGADILTTGSGDDTLLTAAGDDRVQVRGGIDTLDAGTGNDVLTVDYSHLLTNVTGNPTAGTPASGYTGLVADTAGNSVNYSGVESFNITTGTGDDRVRTGGGDDTLSGGQGDDLLQASGGDDVLNGSGGADTLRGGQGADVLTGGRGTDSFSFDNLDSMGRADLITDLQAQDFIDLSRIDADVNAIGDQAFVFVDSFNGAAGEATVTYLAGRDVTRFDFDTDGDSSADITIVAAGNQNSFDNFVL